MAEATERHHPPSIYAKLGGTDRLELVIYACRHRLTRPTFEAAPLVLEPTT